MMNWAAPGCNHHCKWCAVWHPARNGNLAPFHLRGLELDCRRQLKKKFIRETRLVPKNVNILGRPVFSFDQGIKERNPQIWNPLGKSNCDNKNLCSFWRYLSRIQKAWKNSESPECGPRSLFIFYVLCSEKKNCWKRRQSWKISSDGKIRTPGEREISQSDSSI